MSLYGILLRMQVTTCLAIKSNPTPRPKHPVFAFSDAQVSPSIGTRWSNLYPHGMLVVIACVDDANLSHGQASHCRGYKSRLDVEQESNPIQFTGAHNMS